MKWSLMIQDDTLQINLTPENEHEQKAVDLLNEYDGRVSIHRGVSIQESRGGYLRDFGDEEKSLAITIRKTPKAMQGYPE